MKTTMTNTFISQENVIKATIKGLEEAKRNYTFWTQDDLYLSEAPKNFLAIHVAQEIAKDTNPPEIFLDASISDILRCSLKNGETYNHYMSNNNLKEDTFKITLDERFTHNKEHDNDSISRVIISIKNGVRNAKEEHKKEIHKLCKMLHRNKKEDSSIDYGLFAFYCSL